MTKTYKYHGEWVKNTGTKPDLPDGTVVESVLRSGCIGSDNINHLDWRLTSSAGDIIFYRIVSDKAITEAQKQEALEEQRRKDGWVAWGVNAKCATRENPHERVRIVSVDNDWAFYCDGGGPGVCFAKTGCVINHQETYLDLIPYVKEKKTMWNIKNGETYFYIADSSDILSSIWSNDPFGIPRRRRVLGICSRTYDGAKAIRDRLIAEEEKRRSSK